MKASAHITIRCLEPGCPRTKKYPRSLEPTLPAVVAEIHQYCPWHSKEGQKAYPEVFYDAQGRELDWETWKPRE